MREVWTNYANMDVRKLSYEGYAIPDHQTERRGENNDVKGMRKRQEDIIESFSKNEGLHPANCRPNVVSRHQRKLVGRHPATC